jgi:hypothetical protein
MPKPKYVWVEWRETWAAGPSEWKAEEVVWYDDLVKELKTHFECRCNDYFEYFRAGFRRRVHYRGIDTRFDYTDANYSELLRFEDDPEVQKTWCVRCYLLLRFASFESVQLAAVQEDGLAIQHIEHPSEALQLAAVKKNGTAIYYIKDQSEAVQLAAVQNSGEAIYYINNPSEAVQLAAVQQDGHAIRYIENPSKAVQDAVANNPYTEYYEDEDDL